MGCSGMWQEAPQGGLRHEGCGEIAAPQDPSRCTACTAAAGLSLGEYCALVWAGAMEFEDALKVLLSWVGVVPTLLRVHRCNDDKR